MKKEKILFSVIVPFFDEIHMISRAIHSCQQMTTVPLEIIIVNDNPEQVSEDDFIAMQLTAAEDVRVVHHDVNRGLQAARNTGIREASGEFIFFLDSDDYFLEDTLSDLFSYVLKHKADITHFNSYVGKANARRLRSLKMDKNKFSSERVLNGEDVALIGTYSISTWSSVYKKSFLLQEDLFGDEEQRTFEDRLFVLQTMLKAKTLAIYPKSIRVWCRRANSITTSTKDLRALDLKTKAFVKQVDTCMGGAQSDAVKAVLVEREIGILISQIVSGGTDKIYVQLYLSDETMEFAEFRNRISKKLQSIPFEIDATNVFQDLSTRFLISGSKKNDELSRQGFDKIWEGIKSGDVTIIRAVVGAEFPKKLVAAARKRLKLPNLTELTKDVEDGVDYFVHLGTHKTGTTFLQTILADNRELFKENGLLFPETGFGGSPEFVSVKHGGVPGHDGLRKGLLQNDQVLLQELDDEIAASGCSKVLISNENFLSNIYNPNAIRTLAKLGNALARLPRLRSCTFIIYFREPVKWFDSYYRERLACGFPSALKTAGADEFASNYFKYCDYPALVSRLESISGNTVIVRDFEAAKQVGLVPDFLSCVVPDASGTLNDKVKVNEAEVYSNICNAQVEVLHYLRSILPNGAIYKEVARRFLSRTTPTSDRSVLFNHIMCRKIRTLFDNSIATSTLKDQLSTLCAQHEESEYNEIARMTKIPAAYSTELAYCLSTHAILDGKFHKHDNFQRFTEVSHFIRKVKRVQWLSKIIRFAHRLGIKT